MTLFGTPPDPQRKSRRIVWMAVVALALAGVYLFFAFRYYPEKKAAQRFFQAVEVGDMNRAYQLWKPLPTYSMQDFLADWGPNGYYGPVKSFEVGVAKGPRGGGSGVIVPVKVSPFAPFPSMDDAEKSRRTKIVRIWVETKDKSLAFSPI
jgi:hypothetical protein